MTITLAHPPAEDLGRFIEGTLDDASRVAVVDHIADCDDCRIVVVDASEFSEKATAKHGAGGRWWMTAAAAIAILAGGAFIVNARRDPLAPTKEAASHQDSRLVEARLNGFSYARYSVMRGGGQDTDHGNWRLDEEVAKLMERQGNDPRTLHARGVAFLLASARVKIDDQNQAEGITERKDDLNKAVEALLAAATGEPNNASYQSDLAGAYIAKGDLEGALNVCNRALQIEPGSADALFNRAKALEVLERTKDAKSAYENYLKIDSTSPWADEARDHIASLNMTLSPP